MSNNAPDYENDLVFPPISTDVRTTTIEKCERLEKKLETAIKALRVYKNLRYDGTVTGYETIAKEALKEIEG